MNNALIAIGATMVGLRQQVLLAAREIGPVQVDHGTTGCKTPDVSEYIAKMAQRTARRTRVTGARMSGNASSEKARSVPGRTRNLGRRTSTGRPRAEGKGKR